MTSPRLKTAKFIESSLTTFVLDLQVLVVLQLVWRGLVAGYAMDRSTLHSRERRDTGVHSPFSYPACFGNSWGTSLVSRKRLPAPRSPGSPVALLEKRPGEARMLRWGALCRCRGSPAADRARAAVLRLLAHQFGNAARSCKLRAPTSKACNHVVFLSLLRSVWDRVYPPGAGFALPGALPVSRSSPRSMMHFSVVPLLFT